MFKITRKEINWGRDKIILETGKIARQADGAVMVTCGETTLLCVVTYSKECDESKDFLPLTVVYQEKAYAAGKIPGGFFKREGKLSEREVLISRLIDRTIRPLFAEGYHNEVQVICTLLSYDHLHEPDILAMIGSSAALSICGVPFDGPAIGARVGIINDQFVLNPYVTERDDTKLDLVVGGTEKAILMVESEARELSEDKMLEAIDFAHNHFHQMAAVINEMKVELCSDTESHLVEIPAELLADLRGKISDELKNIYQERVKSLRSNKLSALKDKIMEEFIEKGYTEVLFSKAFKEIEKEIVRRQILTTASRIDGRGVKDIRPIAVEVGILPRVHGSALFTRGETQALVVTTLGTAYDEQIIDSIDNLDTREHFMLHYNFPPYSVGETSQLKPPGRREIGHGNLARRAINPMLPKKNEFPYTIRVVSEITESNGSSSMATVCGSSLALMDAGVPLKKPVAGIAMGLILEGEKYTILSDILGDEDYLGDMDFKVAGTEDGVTSLQMDIKVQGITSKIMHEALKQAKEGRMHILSIMNQHIASSRAEVSQTAPLITSMKVAKEKIREIIGTGGKVIKEICEVSGAKLDIDEKGTVKIAAPTRAAADTAIAMIKNIIEEPEIGQIYNGKIIKIVDFGAFVSLFNSFEGLVHISEFSDKRISSVSDVVSVGDEVKVKVIGIDKGKIRLSIKSAV